MKRLVQNFIKLCSASARALRAFFLAYDYPVRLSPEGLPLLAGWETLNEEHNPYQSLNWGLDYKNQQEPTAALIFAQGKQLGEVVYLYKDKGRYTLGTSCTNSIVITTDTLTERRLELEVGDHVRLISEAYDAPLLINGNKVTSAQLVDQDECSFSDAVFYFQDLRGNRMHSESHLGVQS